MAVKLYDTHRKEDRILRTGILMDFMVEKCRVSTDCCLYFKNRTNLTKTDEKMRSFAHFTLTQNVKAL
jgi:hypothetical protein